MSMLSDGISGYKAQRKLKPTVGVHVHVRHRAVGGDDEDYEAQEIKRLESEIKELRKQKSALTPDGALSHMHNAYDAELMQKQGRHLELKGRRGK